MSAASKLLLLSLLTGAFPSLTWDTKLLSASSFRKASILLSLSHAMSLSSVPLLCPEIACALCSIHHPSHLLPWLAPAWKYHLEVYCSKESPSFFFPLWSVTGGTVFGKVSLSLPRCSLALRLSHIANCSYQNFEMLQGICWIHRVKSRKKKVIWCSFQVEKKMLLSTHLLNLICIVIGILAHCE